MRLGFDLDEVVVDLTAELEKYIDINYGIVWPADRFIHYGFRQCKFTDDELFNKRIADDLSNIANDPDFQYQAVPAEGAVDVLHKLKHTGHKIHLISSRPKQNQPLTFRWLRSKGIPFDSLDVIGHSEQKGLYGFKHDLDMYVDDLVKHLESMLLHKKRWRKGLLLFDKPWNRVPIDGSKFKRVDGWYDILRHVGIQNR